VLSLVLRSGHPGTSVSTLNASAMQTAHRRFPLGPKTANGKTVHRYLQTDVPLTRFKILMKSALTQWMGAAQTIPSAHSERPALHSRCSARRLPLSVINITCFGPHGPSSICALPLVIASTTVRAEAEE